jgi:hypothetical protein
MMKDLMKVSLEDMMLEVHVYVTNPIEAMMLKKALEATMKSLDRQTEETGILPVCMCSDPDCPVKEIDKIMGSVTQEAADEAKKELEKLRKEHLDLTMRERTERIHRILNILKGA